ncbi:hypothetical protein A4X13_0g5812 [Tilletia indica]|uniref:Uncharacterized protein n=1 Tax=Tilletia indica TaxID=43049 RepID=A0A8T8SS83_9BASI|nr:hypothetical protein A4X13_0g5812 [Tilletia indica]
MLFEIDNDVAVAVVLLAMACAMGLIMREREVTRREQRADTAMNRLERLTERMEDEERARKANKTQELCLELRKEARAFVERQRQEGEED